MILADMLKYQSDFCQSTQSFLETVKYGDTNAMFDLALRYETEFKDFAKAEEYHMMAGEKGNELKKSVHDILKRINSYEEAFAKNKEDR